MFAIVLAALDRSGSVLPILCAMVVHELAHRVHPDHSPAFHAYVESVLPGAGQLRKEMKTLSGYLTLLRELNEKDLEEQE